MRREPSQGYLFAAASILLVSLAQLAMKWGMTHLPHPGLLQTLATGSGPALALVGLGIVGYGLSLLCWLRALAHLPLSRAYPLLSISYALVYAATACLPWFHEPVHATQIAGIALITLGVWLIVSGKQE